MKNRLSDLIICVPSYRRKNPLILALVECCPDLTFHFCVRASEFNNGFYDEPQFKKDNIRFMLLENVSCIGETREAILQESIRLGYKFCLMIDDTQFCIHDASNRIQFFDTILDNCLRRFETDPLKDKAFSFIFSRKSFSLSQNKQETYFITQLCQTYILNLELIQQYDLHFKRMDVVGVEDLIFYFEACCKGLVALSDTRFLRVGQMPSVKKKGGCHEGNEKRREQDVQNERFDILVKYVNSLDDNLYDKNLVKRVDSILYPGTFYYKFDTDYAMDKLVKCYPFIKDIKIAKDY